MGAQIHEPCINRSSYETVVCGKDIYLGFQHLKELEADVSHAIVSDRAARGDFEGMDDFLGRIAIGVEQISILIRIGAFRFTGLTKRALLWQAHFKLRHTRKEERRQEEIFRVQEKNFQLPQLNSTELEDAFDQMEVLGFPLCSPFLLLAEPPSNEVLCENFPQHLHKTVTLYGYLVSVKNTSTKKGEGMNFGTFYDQSGKIFDTTHFPKIARRYPFRGKGVYVITGKVVEEFGFYSLDISEMHRASYVPDPRYTV